MELTRDALNWFEIAAADFDRAVKFYNNIFDYEMPVMQMGPYQMGFLLHEQGKGVGGAIVAGEGRIPATTGTLVYLSAGNDLTVVLDRIPGAGGTVLVGKTLIAPELGYFAIFTDSEGNKLALHSMN